MCVIAIVENDDQRPSEDEIHQMWAANPYGGGIAWRQNNEVYWKKGLEEDTMVEENKKLPTPYILHFRIPSVGGDKPALCHPFPITKYATPDMEGHGKHSVLFHNGTWSTWDGQSKLWVGAAAGKIKVPPGPWSDSRAMAFWAYHFGLGILDSGAKEPWGINERIAVLSPTGEIQVFGDGWEEVNGFIVSNTGWTFRSSKKKGKESEKEIEKAVNNYFTDPPKSLPPRPGGDLTGKRIELVRVETGNNRKADGPQEVSSIKPHPFQEAREKYETAMIAYMLWMPDRDDPSEKVSKGKVKELKKIFIKMCSKYPDLALPYLTRECGMDLKGSHKRKQPIQFREGTELHRTMIAWELFELNRKDFNEQQKKNLSDIGQTVN